ncbi:MAG: adenylosuccinate lyase, partial [Ignavibacterium sp.]|nr:adenylosuccinate lyase [Ignavibacterium sp.]
MIQRYTLPEMGKIWDDKFKFDTWLKIEILACEARAKLGEIPEADVEIIKAKANYDIKRVLEIEETTKHDVIAFLTNVAEYVGPESRHIHYGMTSSDILDTTLSYQMKIAGELILQQLFYLKDALKNRALEHKNTICVGRSHGVHAEPTTMGLKFALWYEETKRNIDRLKKAIENISVGQISGAVGTFEHLSPKVEEYVCEKLGLKPAPVSTQVIQRDRHAE